jgi:hypothetical protein
MSGGRKEKPETTWANNTTAAYNQANQVSPLQSAFEKSQLDFLNWDKSNGKDVRNAPGLDSYIQIGQAAQAKANQERMGTGALALGGAGSEGYTSNLKSLRQNEMAQDFGTGLENALASRRAEATNSVIPLAQLNNQRNMGVLNASTGLLNMYMNRPPKTPWWQKLVEGGAKTGLSMI